MRCPSCGFDNIDGVDECEQCQTSLTQEDLPIARVRSELARSLLADQVERLRPAEPVAITVESTLADAIVAMRREAIGCVLVVDDQGKLTGILSERDLLLKATDESIVLGRTTVGELMTGDPETTKLEHPLAHAIHRMVVGDHRHLPLVDADGRPAGIVSSRDIVNYLASEVRTIMGD